MIAAQSRFSFAKVLAEPEQSSSERSSLLLLPELRSGLNEIHLNKVQTKGQKGAPFGQKHPLRCVRVGRLFGQGGQKRFNPNKNMRRVIDKTYRLPMKLKNRLDFV